MTTNKWNGRAHDHAWFTAGNWSQGVPVTQQATSFTDGGTWSISLGGSVSAQSGGITITGDVITFTGGTLQADAAPPKQGTPVDLLLNASGALTIAKNATFASNNEILSYGAFTINGTLDASLLAMYGGSIAVTGKSAHVTLSQIQTLYVGGGTLTVSKGGTLDAGPNTLKDFYSYAVVGSGIAPGSMLVEGRGSTITLAHIDVGNGYNGTLSVLHGGTVDAGVVVAGRGGDGFINVSGAGSTLNTLNAVEVGDVNYLPVGSILSVTNKASVNAGTYGVDLHYGTLTLDASAHLTGFIISQVGRIEAISDAAAPQGIVHLSNDIYLQVNNGAQGQYDFTSSVFSQGGATLDLGGVISGDTTTILSAGSGNVILESGSNSYGSTQIYDAKLEIAASGAAGTGSFTFVGTGGTHAILQLDAGVDFANIIRGFAGPDTIDLRGFAFASGVTDTYSAGSLVLSGGSSTATLSVAGSYMATNFAFADDHDGGVLITYTQG